MKKIFILSITAMMVVGCTTTTKTARTESVPYSMYNATIADLEVAPARITYTTKPSKDIQKGGIKNVKQAAIQEALTQNGNADLMLEPEFVISHKKGPFGIFINKVKSITVTGRPATYKNFRSMNDSVWTDPVFRGFRGTSFHVFKK